MRDLIFLPLNETEELVISSDCAGGIGLKEEDIIKAPYDIVGYYAARVAFMELMSIGAAPMAVILQNFVHDEAWNELLRGVKQVISELGACVGITGSTESNMPLLQSAVGLILVGKVRKREKCMAVTPHNAKFAVIGEPLVGEAVIKHGNRIIPLSVFRGLLNASGIYEIVPVGSKGILYELEQLLLHNRLATKKTMCPIPLTVSSGPATSVLISYCPQQEEKIKQIAKDHFFPITFIEA